jgi:hypothetical protein
MRRSWTEKQKGVMKTILHIIVSMRRPLTVGEMAVAAGIATSSDPRFHNDSDLA